MFTLTVGALLLYFLFCITFPARFSNQQVIKFHKRKSNNVKIKWPKFPKIDLLALKLL